MYGVGSRWKGFSQLRGQGGMLYVLGSIDDKV